MPSEVEKQVQAAVRLFWSTKVAQRRKQVTGSGKKDQGSRSAVTGGKHLDGFASLFRGLAERAGVPEANVFSKKSQVVLPGFFRATKQWDIVIVHSGKLLAAIEFKSQVGSLGNNANNRAEEAVGNATDFWVAYRESLFQTAPRPWLGYLFLLEDSEDSTTAVQLREPHFPALGIFQGSSYMDRYLLCCKQMMRERLYDAAALIASDRKRGVKGYYREPDPEVGIRAFVASLAGHLKAQVDSGLIG